MENLIKCINNVLAKREIASWAMDKRGLESIFEKLDKLKNRLEFVQRTYQRVKHKEEPLKIGILGEFSAGKSMFVNSLLGENLLGVDIAPKTARVTLIKYGDQIRFYGIRTLNDVNVEKEELSQEEYNKLANKGDSSDHLLNASDYDYFEIHFPSEILRLVNILDTPGFSETYENLDNITIKWMNKVDIIFWIIDGIQGPTRSSIKRMDEIPNGVPVMAVLNKLDKLSPKERQRMKNYIKNNYEFKKVFLYSAKAVLDKEEEDKSIKLTLYELMDNLRKIMEDRASFVVDSCLDDDFIWIMAKNLKSKSINNTNIKKRPLKKYYVDPQLLHEKEELIETLKEFKKFYINYKVNSIMKELEDMPYEILKTFQSLKKFLEKEKHISVDKLRRSKVYGVKHIEKQYSNLKEQMLDDIEENIGNGFYSTVPLKRFIEKFAKELTRRADNIMRELRNEFEDSYNGIILPKEEEIRDEIIKKFIDASVAALNVKNKCPNLRKEDFDLLIADEQICDVIKTYFVTNVEVMISVLYNKYHELLERTNNCIKFLESNVKIEPERFLLT